MSTLNELGIEYLTDAMIEELRSDALADGDDGAVWACDDAVTRGNGRHEARNEVCERINERRRAVGLPYYRVVNR